MPTELKLWMWTEGAALRLFDASEARIFVMWLTSVAVMPEARIPVTLLDPTMVVELAKVLPPVALKVMMTMLLTVRVLLPTAMPTWAPLVTGSRRGLKLINAIMSALPVGVESAHLLVAPAAAFREALLITMAVFVIGRLPVLEIALETRSPRVAVHVKNMNMVTNDSITPSITSANPNRPQNKKLIDIASILQISDN